MRMTFSALLAGILALAAGHNAFAQENREKKATFGGPGIEGAQSRLLKELQARSLGAQIDVIKNAPFSGEMVCECTETLADGTRTIHRTTIVVHRDGGGRIHQEISFKIRDTGSGEYKEQKAIRVIDRFGGQVFTLDPQQHTGHKFKVPQEKEIRGLMTIEHLGSGGAPNGADIAPSNACGPAKPFGGFGDNPEIKNEPLGTQMIEGISAKGTRTTYTIPAGSIGNERPVEVTSDKWYSQELGIDVLIKLNDPRSGESMQQMTRISRGEPDAALFEIPPDYTIREFTFRSPTREMTPGPAGRLDNQASPRPMSASLKPTILYKEKASYTEDARRNGIQGTVVLNVVFTADSTITQIRVVRGLPDGLTEKAVEAALKTRFQPAVENGIPVSVRGNLEFTFVLDQ